MKITIEKNIPIPGPKVYTTKYPFANMDIGDSFFVACPKGESVNKFRNSIQVAVANRKKKTGHSFTTRSDANGIRVWRIDPDATDKETA